MAQEPLMPQMPSVMQAAQGMPGPYPKFKAEHFYLFGGINSKASAYANNPTEFRDLSNFHFLYPGSLTKRPGSTMYVGATVAGSILGGVEFAKASGQSQILFAANTNFYSITPPMTVNPVVTGLQPGAIFSFVTYLDNLFCANGANFFKFDGTNNFKYSLPPGATAAWGVTATSGGSLTTGVTTTFTCGYGYVNERGYAGPVSKGVTITIDGITNNSITYYGMTIDQLGYGITAIQLWRTTGGGANFFGTTLVAAGATQATDTGFPLGTSLALPHMWFTLIPRFQQVYNNQFFMAGFSTFPSRVYWSEIGEPEGVQPTYFADFISNDGDRITGLKYFQGGLIVSKQKSLFVLTGTDPSNFSIQQITDQYGCLSNQAMVTFENKLWMLDQKGILQFDGANVQIISMNPEPFFLQMNVPYALDYAVAAHFKQFNQVWFHVPYQGSTINNLLMVYDYVTNSWTRYDGINSSYLFVGQGTNPTRTVFYGGYTGALSFMGSSFFGDNGNAITCMAFTKWHSQMGQTVENMYRRFWMNVDPVLGVTSPISVNIFANYSSNTVAFSGAIYQSVFQTRLDFGISARAIAAQFVHASASLPLKVDAYTFESRYQRST